MADKYQGTILPQTSDPIENQKAILDLLKKINEVSAEKSTPASSNETVTLFEPVVFAGHAPDVAAGATYINYTVGEGVNTYIDTHNAMNAATGVWTCPIAGKYRITATRHVGSGTEGRDITNFFLNNALFGEIVETWGQYDDVDGSKTLNLLYGDTIKIVKHASISKTGSIDLYIERIQIDASVSTTASNIVTSVEPNYGAYTRPAFYRYYTTDNAANQYIHFKTNQTMNSVMFAVQFQGYEYGASKPVDAMIVGYPSGSSNDVINKGSSGTHTCGAYKSSDGYVVLTFYSTNCYYLGLILNQIGAGPQGLYPLIITQATHSSSATGVY